MCPDCVLYVAGISAGTGGASLSSTKELDATKQCACKTMLPCNPATKAMRAMPRHANAGGRLSLLHRRILGELGAWRARGCSLGPRCGTVRNREMRTSDRTRTQGNHHESFEGIISAYRAVCREYHLALVSARARHQSNLLKITFPRMMCITYRVITIQCSHSHA